MQTVNLSDAKNRLSELVDEVTSTHERVTVTRNGLPVVMIVAVDDMEGLMETLDILSEPGALEEIRAAEAEITEGNVITAEQLRAEVAARVAAGE
jgi:antitoxin YefM